ncbi:tyrosine-type recombinase/integrase [Candidatus Latescibacterota bacterium]
MAVVKRNKIWYVYYNITVDGRRVKRGEAIGPRKDVAVAVEKKYRDMIRNGLDPREMDSTLDESENVNMPQTDSFERMVTFREFFPMFMELHGNHQSESMRSSYKLSFNHLAPGFGNLQLAGISKIKVQTYMTRRKRTGVSNATVNREVTFLKSLLQRAVDWGYIDMNPLRGFKLLKEAPIRERYLTKEEGERLIQASPDYLRDIILFALATGFRKSEIFGLTWDNVILNKRFTYGEISVIGKGNKRRNIRMNKTVFSLLCRKIQKKKSKYVFPSPKTGGKIDNVNRAFQTALKEADIENFRFHDLRHTAASWMVQGGADIYAVQKILGHSNISTTQRYAHQSPEYLENQIKVLDEFLGVDEKQQNVSEELACAV